MQLWSDRTIVRHHHHIGNERSLRVAATVTRDTPWDRTKARAFGSGREALIALVQALDLPAGAPILVPTYVPEGVIDPFRRSGLTVVQYPLDRFLDPEWEMFGNLVARHEPRLAVMIHYFGIQKDIVRFSDICRPRGTLVIEDMAHAVPSPGSALGQTGDFVLYSLPKMLGVPDGAILECRNEQVPPNKLKVKRTALHGIYVALQLCSLACNTLAHQTLFRGLWKRAGPALAAASYRLLMRCYITPNPMSRVASFLLDHTEWDTMILHRHALESRYDSGLDRTAFTRFPAPADALHCAFGFPVLVDRRESFISYLGERGVRGVVLETRWDFLRREPQNLEAIKSMKRHFLFPTAYHLTEQDVDRVVALANEWAKLEAAARAQ